jgi:cytochrome c-type biogenesis protein CcmH
VFWLLSVVILLIAVLVACWPLFRKDSRWKASAIGLLALVPAGAVVLYQAVGTPEGIDVVPPAVIQSAEDMESLTSSLRERLTESPEDLEGWLLLGRSYKTTQQFPEALEALETANRIAPGNPIVQVELIEARLFASGNPRLTSEMTALLEKSLEKDPGLQKALWLMGIAAMQNGDEETAIAYWQQLLNQLQPGNPIAETVGEQISQARSRLGIEAEPQWQGIDLRVSVPGEIAESIGSLPPQAVLFLIARSPGVSGGPPLGVRRVDQPVFPVEMNLNDRDSMMQQRRISAESQVELQARLSMSGTPQGNPGDWQSATKLAPTNSAEPIELIVDKLLE